jgi:hypothetical protein
MKGNRIVAIGATLVVAGMLAAPAQARVGHHCVVRLQPIAPKAHNGVIKTKQVDLGCFASFAEAIRVGSGGAILLSADATPAGLTQAELSAATTVVPNTSVLIGTEYTGLGYTADSRNYWAPTACAGDDIWETNYVGDAWNDMFRSGKGFGGCDHNRKFGAADFAGTSIVCTPNCGDYGVLDMKVSSLRWKP